MKSSRGVYLSTRSGAHVLNRLGPFGEPYDYILYRRIILKLMDILPYHWLSWLLEICYTSPTFSQNLYTVPADHHILSTDPVINDQIGSKLLSGSVVQTKNIHHFTKDGVVFEGDAEVTKADVVIMATGYTWGFPFLEEGVVVKEKGMFNLYKLMYPTQLAHGTLAVIGFLLPFGPGFPSGELQARWAVQILANKCRLPSQQTMMEDVEERYKRNLRRYAPREKMCLRVEGMQYADEIASQFGVRPSLLKILFTDFALFRKLCFGPTLPYQYRLQGPHAWDGAREAIMTSEDRLFYPLKGSKNQGGNNHNVFKRLVMFVVRFCFGY